jgi:hypothetical protein
VAVLTLPAVPFSLASSLSHCITCRFLLRFDLKNGDICSTEASVDFYRTTLSYKPEDYTFYLNPFFYKKENSFTANVQYTHRSATKMEVVYFSEIIVLACQTTWCYNTEHHNMNNLFSSTTIVLFTLYARIVKYYTCTFGPRHFTKR